jgi:hypothetical protein
MPQPTLGDVHVNRPLTNISVAYSQEMAGVEYVADRAFPAIPVESASDLYYSYNRGDFNRDEMALRAIAAESAGGGYRLSAAGTYNCQVWSLHKDIDDRIRANSDSPLAPDRDATIYLTQQALTRRERLWASKFYATGLWTGELAGQATSDSTHVKYWNDDSSSPIEDIRGAKTQMRLNSGGFTGNVGIFSRPVFDKLVDHPDFIDRTKYGQTAPNPAMANRRIIAEILELEEVLVMDAVYNSAPEETTGLVETNAFIGGKSFLLAYRPKNPGLMTPSAGYTFNWTGLIGQTGGAGVRMKTFRMEQLASDRAEIDMAVDMVQVGKDLGYFFLNVIQ